MKSLIECRICKAVCLDSIRGEQSARRSRSLRSKYVSTCLVLLCFLPSSAPARRCSEVPTSSELLRNSSRQTGTFLEHERDLALPRSPFLAASFLNSLLSLEPIHALDPKTRARQGYALIGQYTAKTTSSSSNPRPFLPILIPDRRRHRTSQVDMKPRIKRRHDRTLQARRIRIPHLINLWFSSLLRETNVGIDRRGFRVGPTVGRGLGETTLEVVCLVRGDADVVAA